MKRTLGAFLIALACALVAPGVAGAAVTVGPANANPSPGTSQAIPFPDTILLFTAAGPAGAQLTAPSDGVITSWQFYTDDVDGEGVTAQLRTLTPAGPNSYVVSAAAGPVEPIPPVDATGPTTHNVQHVFSAQLPIGAGQMVGVMLEHPAGVHALPVLPAESGMGWKYGCLGPGCGGEEPVPGTPVSGAQIPEQWVAMNAKVEPDADHDGLGDETQDPCVGACQPTTPAPAKKKCRKGKKLKHGKCVKKHKKHHKHHR